jgi:FlaA1/EpsC-like NDP-sugar epimerase
MTYKKIFLIKFNQFLIDILIFIFSYFLAFIIRFEGIPDAINLKQLLILFPCIALARVLFFYIFSIYSIVWRYISILDAISITKASIPVTAILFLGRLFLPNRLSILRLPLSVIALEFLLVLIGTLGIRMIRRLVYELSEMEKFEGKVGNPEKRRTLLIGAGNAGNMVIKELKQRRDLGIEVVGFIDDDPKKLNTVIQGVKVLGNTAQLLLNKIIEKSGEAKISLSQRNRVLWEFIREPKASLTSEGNNYPDNKDIIRVCIWGLIP